MYNPINSQVSSLSYEFIIASNMLREFFLSTVSCDGTAEILAGDVSESSCIVQCFAV